MFILCIFRDTICLIDWKTSKKPKPYLSSTFDYPLQVCAYIGAYNADPANTIKVNSSITLKCTCIKRLFPNYYAVRLLLAYARSLSGRWCKGFSSSLQMVVGFFRTSPYFAFVTFFPGMYLHTYLLTVGIHYHIASSQCINSPMCTTHPVLIGLVCECVIL